MAATRSRTSARDASTARPAEGRTRAARARKAEVPDEVEAKGKGKRLLDGKPASVRHFLCDRQVHQSALERADAQGVRLSEVMRLGLSQYAAQGKAPKGNGDQEKAPRLLDAVATDLRSLWDAGDTARVNAYLAALHRQGGWSLSALADTLVDCGAVTRISRQAVQLRVAKAPQEVPEDLPPVPVSGLRRGAGPGREQLYDFSFYVTDEEYGTAQEQATFEGAQMSTVAEDILRRYASGEFRVALVEDEDADT